VWSRATSPTALPGRKINGFSIDILHAIEARTGLQFDIRVGNWTVYNSFKDGRLDAVDAISMTEARRRSRSHTNPYHLREIVLFGVLSIRWPTTAGSTP
ncbi:MAG: transporter substrate-binding domain-containing protein, partial [Simplicispira sp.]|nr:transporter substrate-binding domain-containing protein [Simplicispira sp.]